jgi:hypothetical protein
MTRTIQKILATIAGIATFVLAYRLTVPLLEYGLHWLAGDSVIYQEVYRDFSDSPFLFILQVLAGCYFGLLSWRYTQKFFQRFVVPVPLTNADTLGTKPLSVRVFVNGQDEQGQSARQELFSQELTAESLFQFFWSGDGKALLLRGKPGVYLQISVAPKSPYVSEGQGSENAFIVKVRTRKHILHNFESVFGKVPTFTVQEGKSLAYYRLPLDYVGSQTESNAMLVVTGERRVMEKVFFTPKNRPNARVVAA